MKIGNFIRTDKNYNARWKQGNPDSHQMGNTFEMRTDISEQLRPFGDF